MTSPLSRSSDIRHPTSDVREPSRSRPESIDPSWRRWVDLVAIGVSESQRPVWAECLHLQLARKPDAPLLDLATLRIEPGHASRVVRRLAGELGIPGIDRVDPLSLIRAGIERDTATIDVLADRLAIRGDTVAVLAQLSALPLLLNAAKKLAADAARSWQRGYCPVCGAWPALAEMRGIQRERRMRCGCCGGDWMLPVLRCAFCSEIDHRKLGFFLAEERDQNVRVETCSTCRGYLKTFSTLSALEFPTLALKDLETVAFDIAARERGCTRPALPGWQLQVEIVQ